MHPVRPLCQTMPYRAPLRWKSTTENQTFTERICKGRSRKDLKEKDEEKNSSTHFRVGVWRSIFQNRNTEYRSKKIHGDLSQFLPPHLPSEDETPWSSILLYLLSGRHFVPPFPHPHVTGILLMFHYTPSIERAYFDMQALALIFNGKILRNLHRWSAHGMVVTVFLHMVRVFYTRSYRPPREFNWVIGIGSSHPYPRPQLYRISSSLGSIGLLGNHRGNNHHELHSLHWERYSVLCAGSRRGRP